jgi:hypothetical protein
MNQSRQCLRELMSMDVARDIMDDFARRTGLTTDVEPTRYLWTDAFAVCNYVGLARELHEPHFIELAQTLVEQVHAVLGKYRDDDERSGWLSGMDGSRAAEHPTACGLRIGKPRPERGPDERFDPRAEWDRDGQYFHYLTKWMHALDVLSRATQDARYLRWACELAVVAHDAFVYRPDSGSRRQMYWKMSVDLSRPLVPSMGHHDPLDGMITCGQLLDAGRRLERSEQQRALESAASDFEAMCEGRDFTTDDPLGLGGLMMDATRVVQLPDAAPFETSRLLESLIESADRGMRRFESARSLERPARSRLAFRELGLAIGIEGVERFGESIEQQIGQPERVESILERFEMVGRVVDFWLQPAHREQPTWSGHRDINEVMLASALAPGGVLDAGAEGRV